MRCQHVDDDIQCRFDASRRVRIACGDPLDPDQSGFAGPSTWSRSVSSTTPTPAVDAAAAHAHVNAHRRTSQTVIDCEKRPDATGGARRDAARG
jgi:hypothetical protein